MIETLATLGTLAVGAGFMAPKTRAWFLGDLEQDWLCNELNFDRIDEDGETVHLKSGPLKSGNLKSGSRFKVIWIGGQPYETKTAEEEEVLCAIRTDLFHALADLGCTARLFGLKREVDLSFEATWPCTTLEEIGAAEQKLIRRSYDLKWFLVLQSKNGLQLEKASRAALSSLSDYRPQIIRAAEAEARCPLTGFVNYLATGELRGDLPRISANLSGCIPACDLHIETNGLIRTFVPHETLSRIVAVRNWPDIVTGQIISDIMALPGDIEIMQVLKPRSSVKMAAIYQRKAMECQTPMFRNEQAASEFEMASEMLRTDSAMAFETQTQITVRATSEAALNTLTRQVCERLSKRRVLHSTDTNGAEGKGASVAWFNRMPGRETLLRPLTIFNRSVAALWPFASSPKGMMSGPYGKMPVRLLRTPSGSSYAFQFHVSDAPQSPGNYLVFAPTGGGKSTLMMHLLGGMTKYPNFRSYVFDSKDGARFMIEAMGGVYQGYEDLALNPFDIGKRSSLTDQAITQVLRSMIGESWSADMEASISNAIEIAMQQSTSENRTLNAIYSTAFPRGSAIRAALAKWVRIPNGRTGPYHHIFNSPRDSLTSFLAGSHIVGINMNEALDDPDLGPAIVAHISQKITETAKSGGGFGIFVDEAARLLQNTGFQEVVMEMYREYRKLDGFVGLAFQDPEGLLKFEGHEAMLNNAQTLIFLPNSKIKAETLAKFNLNDEQMEFIMGKRSAGAGRQVMVIKQDAASGRDESAILNVDLSPLGESLRFYRAGTEANRHLEALKAEWGTEWLSHL